MAGRELINVMSRSKPTGPVLPILLKILSAERSGLYLLDRLHAYPPARSCLGRNTLHIGGAIPDDELIEAIDASYAAVVSKLPKKERP